MTILQDNDNAGEAAAIARRASLESAGLVKIARPAMGFFS